MIFSKDGPRIGFVLATEEHAARHLVSLAKEAESRGFGFLFISDHFHPWNEQQGHSSNLWPLLGAMAQGTDTVELISAVTCPILRIHPTTLAQAASTVYHLSGGRFHLGLGTGEALNERVVGRGFPNFEERLARLSEAVDMIRELLRGEGVTSTGEFFAIENATLFDAAPELRILVAASGERTARFAAEADGLICLGARPELVEAFDGQEKPKLTQLSVCWAPTAEEATETAHRYFPEVAMDGTTFTKLSTPAEFTQAAQGVSVADVAASIPCGPEPKLYLEAIEECFEAGFDRVALHQIGPNQNGFFEFWERELRPKLR